jgi:hypothetical protein
LDGISIEFDQKEFDCSIQIHVNQLVLEKKYKNIDETVFYIDTSLEPMRNSPLCGSPFHISVHASVPVTYSTVLHFSSIIPVTYSQSDLIHNLPTIIGKRISDLYIEFYNKENEPFEILQENRIRLALKFD